MTHSRADVNGNVDKIKQLLPFPDYFQEEFPNHYQSSGNSLSPFHNDTNPSFTLHDTWGYSHQDSKSRDIFDLRQFKYGGTFQDAKKYFNKRLGLINGDKPSIMSRSESAAPKHQVQTSLGEPTETYDYRDELENHLFQVCRYEPKTFRQRVINLDGSITWKVSGTRQVLFRLPELLAAPIDEPVLVLEGEKDVEVAESLGFYATCAPGGAGPGKWKSLCKRWNIQEPLKDRIVWIIPDADDVGRAYAIEIAESLSGYAKSIKIIELFPGRTDGSDLTDWVHGNG
jgi:hypothetical protein